MYYKGKPTSPDVRRSIGGENEKKEAAFLKMLEISLEQMYGKAISNVKLSGGVTRTVEGHDGIFQKVGSCVSSLSRENKSKELSILKGEDGRLYLFDDGHYWEDGESDEDPEADHVLGQKDEILMPIFLVESSQSEDGGVEVQEAA